MLRDSDFLDWDVVNWSVCFRVWEPHLPASPCECLELGCGSGGLSLWLASKGHRVVCSDLSAPGSPITSRHSRHGVGDKMRYEAIDATDIPYSGRFDVIVFKSVLPCVWAHCGLDGVQRAVHGMQRALKPGGRVLFVENLRSTRFHMFCRRRFLHRTLVYPTIPELYGLFTGDGWGDFHFETAGFLGAFGRTEGQRAALGYLDRLITPLVPGKWHYVMAGVAVKEAISGD
jgi:SAM-dependent methyltransferase